MRKVYFLGALSGLLLASCANDDLVVKPVVNPGETDDAISFNLRLGNQSRATALEDVMNNFGVWSIKANDNKDFGDLALNLGAANMSANVVINDYKVYYDDATHYGSQWTYLTSDKPDSIPELQFLKYWDGSVKYNYFFGYAPHNTKHKDDLVTFKNKNDAGKAELGYSIKTTSDPNYKFLYSDATVAKSVDYLTGSTTDPKKVNLNFHYLLGQVRLAFWESIQGYSVELENVEFSSAPSYTNATANFGVAGIPAEYNPTTWTLGKYAEEGNAKVEYSYNTTTADDYTVNTPEVTFSDVNLPSGKSTYLDFAIPTGDISTTRPEATLSPTTYNVVPNADPTVSPEVKNCGFQFVLNYTLKAEDTNEVIHVKGARVFVPADYTQWNKNTVYTYVFQITKDSSGTTTDTKPGPDPEDPEDALYPIIFDGLTISDPDTNDTYWVVNQTLAFDKDVYVVSPDDSASDHTAKVQVNLGYEVDDVDDDDDYYNTDGKIYWTSSDTNGFTVENATTTASGTTSTNTITGVITTGGEYTLTADYYGTKATTTVVVGAWGTISDYSMTVDDNEYTINSPLSGVTLTNTTITWTSSKPEVATVDDNGKVTPVSAGQTTITATLGNKTATCIITVKDLKVEPYAITSLVTGNTVQLVVNYYDGTSDTPTDVASSATYSEYDNKIINVSTAGVVSPVGTSTGITNIKVTYDGMSRIVEARVNQVNP